MEATLFINMDDILQYTTIGGNTDIYKINPHIYNSQILYLEPILGSDLYTKLETIVSDGTITSSGNTNYNTLLVTYVTPSLVFHTMELFIPANAYVSSDGGTFQFTPTNAQYSPINEIEKIANKYRVIGSKYDDKLVAYLCKNSTLFPEYINNTGLVKKTETTNRATGWYLGTSNITSKIRI